MAASTARETTALLAAVRSSADALCRLAAERDWTSEEAEALAAVAARAGGVEPDVARAALCARALGDARLQTLPPRIAAEALVRIFVALAPAHGASLWLSGSPSRASCALALGEGGVDGCARAAEAALVGGRSAALGDLLAVPVRCWQSPAAALVVRADTAHRSVVTELADDAVAALAVVLEREALLERGLERERLLVESSERRLARLAFDIHDGPLQTVAALGLELRLLGSDPYPAEAFQGAARVLELQERVAVLEAELRELTHTLEPTTIARRPLAATLADQVAAFGTQHGVAARLDAAGDLTGLSPSQRIALVRVVHEALANARDHGGATEIYVEVRTDRRGVHASVADNGCGFDVGQTLPAAARKGRLGLVGMSERVRLLGGRLDVESRVGGPTTITASLPWWNPVADAADDGVAQPLPLPVAAVT